MLFEEARRRRWRRRLAGGLAGLLSAGVAVAAVVGGAPGPRPAPGSVATGRNPIAAAHKGMGRLPAVRAGWVDSSGQMHVGALATRAQLVVARVGASPADPMIPIGGGLYWSDDGGVNPASQAFVEELNLATGRIRHVARGESVFPSVNGRHLYIKQAETRLVERPAAGDGPARRLTLPVGWSLPSGLGGWAVAGGIVVYSGGAGGGYGASLGIWNPRTGQVQVIGTGDLFDASTPPGARYSLFAWKPDSCAARLRCPIAITNTSAHVYVILAIP